MGEEYKRKKTFGTISKSLQTETNRTVSEREKKNNSNSYSRISIDSEVYLLLKILCNKKKINHRDFVTDYIRSEALKENIYIQV